MIGTYYLNKKQKDRYHPLLVNALNCSPDSYRANNYKKYGFNDINIKTTDDGFKATSAQITGLWEILIIKKENNEFVSSVRNIRRD